MIVNYVTMGVAVLLVVGCFCVLIVEQKRPGELRRGIIAMLGVFSVLAVVLLVVPLWRELSANEQGTLAAKITDLTKTQRDFEIQRDSQRGAVENLRQQLEERSNEKQALAAELTALRGKLSLAEEQIKAQETTVAKLNAESALVSERAKSLSSENERLTKEAESLTKSLRDEQARYAQAQSDLKAQSEALQREPGRTHAAAKANEQPYSVVQDVRLGQTFVDKLTGVTLSITSFHKFLFSSTMRLHGSISFPGGSAEAISGDPPGKTWKYRWNNRDFVITVSLGDVSGTFKVTVLEFTEVSEQ